MYKAVTAEGVAVEVSEEIEDVNEGRFIVGYHKHNLINNIFSGSSLNIISSLHPQAGLGACQAGAGGRGPRQVWGEVGDTIGKVLVPRPGGGRGVKHCDHGG